MEHRSAAPRAIPRSGIRQGRCLVAVLRAGLLCALVASASAQKVTVLVAYFSQTGNTESMAEAVAEGARSEDADVVVKRIGDVTKADLEAADGIALGSPVHMGDVAVEVRSALVDWAYGKGFWRSRGLENKACAVFATGGAPSNGKEFTMLSMALGLLQYGMVLVTPYGGLGASATTGVPEHEKGVGEHELSEARGLGARLARVALRLRE
ncbi:MAG: flavodoxin family protein [Bryobacterales bacterium]|nr:flavodoxin family protein [Bryobacterales bacterium]MDE0628393.1 flavodoxin family protein [Bryobacterales bacterium]